MKPAIQKEKRNIVRSWTSLVILIVVVLGVISLVWLTPSSPRSQKGFTVSQEMEYLFREQYLNDLDVDSGITILLLSFHSKANDTQAGEFIDFAVLNHSSENISFPNAAYGLRIFSPEEAANRWNEISTVFPLGSDETLLAQHTETYGKHTNNSFFLLYSDFENTIPEKLRICVFGVGQLSHKKYAACENALREK